MMRAAGFALAGLLVTPVVPADAAAKPPVVKIALEGNHAKVSGAKGLKAGWVTLRLRATDKRYHDLYLGMARNGDAGPRGKGAMAPQGIRKSAPAGGQNQSQAAIYARSAQQARDAERSALSLGGVRVTKAAAVDLTVHLPAGTTVLLARWAPTRNSRSQRKRAPGSRPAGLPRSPRARTTSFTPPQRWRVTACCGSATSTPATQPCTGSP
jgi:hypothetical protein